MNPPNAAIPPATELPIEMLPRDQSSRLPNSRSPSALNIASIELESNLQERAFGSPLPGSGPITLAGKDQDSTLLSIATFSTVRDLEIDVNGIRRGQPRLHGDAESILETREPVGRIPSAKELKKIGGHFILESALGHGASGTVFRAYDETLERYVAIKVIHQALPCDSTTSDSSFEEARSLAKLAHPGIVQIYEVGKTAFSPFLVTELVDGPSLREYFQQSGGISFRTVAEIIRDVSEALDFAHKNGVLHRDLKPSNILLTNRLGQRESSPNTPERVCPKITDFGLAKRIDQGLSSSKNQIVGTPAYMSPEAACGAIHAVNGQSDLFSLGVVLYELLTGRLPFSGALNETLSQVRQCKVAPPRNFDRKIPADLEAICLKCLQKLPENRYPSAADLHADLSHWLQGRPITARQTPRIERLTKWCRRQPLLATATMASFALCSVVAGLALTLFLFQNFTSHKEQLRKVDQLLNANDALAEPLMAVRSSVGSLEIVRDRLQMASLSERDRTRLLLVEGPGDRQQIQFLSRWLTENSRPEEFDLIADWLAPHQAALNPSLQEEADDQRALRICLAMLRWQAKTTGNQSPTETLAELLISPDFDSRWLPHLKPYRGEIVAALIKEYQSETTTQSFCESGCALLCQLCSDDCDLLCSILQIAGDDDVDVVCESLSRHRIQAIERLSRSAAAYSAASFSAPRAKPSQSPAPDAYFAIHRLTRTIIALAQLSSTANDWEQFFDVADPRVEAYFVQAAVRQGLGAKRLAALLAQNPRPLALRAVILAMDGLRPRQFRAQPVLLAWLHNAYESHPDAGVHSAIRYCLEKFEQGPWANAADLPLRNVRKLGFNWFVDQLGQTMVILPSKVSCVENGVNAPLTIAISSTEITYHQLRAMNYSTYNKFTGKSPADDTAAQLVSPARALDFCRALDDLHQVAAEDRAVIKRLETPLDANSVALNTTSAVGWSLFEIDRRKSGYRLPTSAELEMAADFDHFSKAWERDNEPAWLGCYCHPRPLHPVTTAYSRMPNRLGFFQVLGNVWEWTMENEGSNSTQSAFTIAPQDRLHIFAGPINGATKAIQGKVTNPHSIAIDHPQVGFRIVRSIDVAPIAQ